MPRTSTAMQEKKKKSCSFSALVHPQGAAPFCLNTPAMTPCCNVGSAARYGSTGNCIQSTLMVPVSIRMLLFQEPSRYLPTLNCMHTSVCPCFSPLLEDVRRSLLLVHPRRVFCTIVILLLLQLL